LSPEANNADGQFSIPMFVHDQVPPRVPVMKRKTHRDFLHLRRVASRWHSAY